MKWTKRKSQEKSRPRHSTVKRVRGARCSLAASKIQSNVNARAPLATGVRSHSSHHGSAVPNFLSSTPRLRQHSVHISNTARRFASAMNPFHQPDSPSLAPDRIRAALAKIGGFCVVSIPFVSCNDLFPFFPLISYPNFARRCGNDQSGLVHSSVYLPFLADRFLYSFQNNGCACRTSENCSDVLGTPILLSRTGRTIDLPISNDLFPSSYFRIESWLANFASSMLVAIAPCRTFHYRASLWRRSSFPYLVRLPSRWFLPRPRQPILQTSLLQLDFLGRRRGRLVVLKSVGREAWGVDKIAPSPTPHIPGFFCCASDLLAVFLVAAIFLGSILDEKELYVGHPHFMVVFNPVVQVLQGKALLINAVSQYGLYPDFLRPVFALSGLSVLKFTALIGLLTALSFAALWLVLKKAIHHRAIAVIGFLALVGNTWLNRLPDPARESLVDLYYQYFPIRFLFPALAVLLAWKYFQCPSRWLYWFLTVLLATGILWNFDAGVPSFLAWVSALCYAALFESGLKNKVRTIACHGAAAGGALLAVLGAYAGQGFLRFGELPHFQEFWHYQMLFYVSGFYMLPMPFPATWVVVVLVYLSGLAYAAHALSEKKNTPRAHLVFLLSILGAGLFSNNKRRSHPQVLAVCWWPCFPLLAIFLDENLAILGHGSSGVEREPWTESPHAPRPTLHDPSTLHEPFHWISALLLVLVLAGSSCNILAQSRLAGHWIRQHLRLARSAAPSPEDEDVSLLKKVIPAGQEVLVLSPREGLMHLKSGIPSLARFCMFQL